MTGTPLHKLLARWPGRFRSPELLASLGREGDTSARALADGILRSIADGQDAAGAIGALVRAGRFDAAERAINQCPDLDEECRDSLRRDLLEGRAQAVQQTEARAAEQLIRAQSAELDSPLDLAHLVRRAEEDREEAFAEIAAECLRIDSHLASAVPSLGPEVDPLLRHHCAELLVSCAVSSPDK